MRTLRQLRLATALIIATFVALHFTNHALGVLSVSAQEGMRQVTSPVWRSWPGAILLYGSLAVHFLLGLYALWRRETLRMPQWELWQILLGLSIPWMLVPHIVGTHGAASVLGTQTTYEHVVLGLWSKTETLVRQPLLVVVVWTHLSIGLHFWLRLRAGYRRWLPAIQTVAVIVPLLALLGFWGAGLEIRARGAAEPSGTGAYPADDYGGTAGGDAAGKERLEQVKDTILGTCGGLLLLVVGAREVRRWLRMRRGTYRIHHASGRTLRAPIGQTLLEALRDARIPHASVCGGRARCTTCRVRIGRGAEALPEPAASEAQALRRIGADPGVRLACQIRPRREVHVTPLLPADCDATAAGRHDVVQGRERKVAVMFIDLRESSRLAERRLPYDVIFILNRFFAEMAEALRETDGYYSTFNGDGLMALYGIDSGMERGCRDALSGAAAAVRRMAGLNATLAAELARPLRVGVGIHAGEAIVGTMGPPATPITSALGDTVNVAARLEAETKRLDCALVVSEACARAAGLDLSAFERHSAEVRNRTEPVSFYAIPEPEALVALIDAVRSPASADP